MVSDVRRCSRDEGDTYSLCLRAHLRQKKKVNCFSGPPSSVSNAPHLSFFQTGIKKKWPHLFFSAVKIKISTFYAKNEQKKRCLIVF